MPPSLSPAQAQAMTDHFRFLMEDEGDRRFRQVGMQLQLSGILPEAVLLHCGGVDPAVFWEARGLKGYRAGRSDQARRKRDEIAAVTGRLFDSEGTLRGERVNDFIGQAIMLLNQMLSGSDGFLSQSGLADKKVVLIVGFWRSMGTLMLWRVLRRLGVEPLALNPLMIHDNMPDLGVLERDTWWAGHLSAWFQICQFLVWARQAFAAHPVVVQKNSSHTYWLSSLDSLLGERAVYQFTIRHPVASAISLFSTFAKDVERYAADRCATGPTAVWYKTVRRAFGTSLEEWERLTHLEKAIENWAAYHVLANLTGDLARRLHVYRFGDDLEVFLARSLPYTVDAPPEEDEIAAPSSRDLARFMTPAVADRAARAIERARQHFATFGIALPDLPPL